MGIRRTLRSGIALCAIVMLPVASCSSAGHPAQRTTTSATAPAGWPPVLDDFTIVWSAEPGIDLTTWPAVVVRAYTESYVLASITSSGNYLYPGFKNSVGPDKSLDDPIGTQFLWPTTTHPSENGWVGTAQYHMLSITTAGRDVVAVVCEYMFGSAEQGRYGGFIAHLGLPPPRSGILPMRLTMTARADPAPAMPAQQGPARAPSVDVFDGWRITSHQGGWFAGPGVWWEWPDVVRDSDTCVAKAPEHRDLIRGMEYDRSVFPALPAYPGWPSRS